MNPSPPKKDYTKLKELLEAHEQFPHLFTFKFVGLNSPKFNQSVQGLEKAFPGLQHELTRESRQGNHVSKTYRLHARDAEEILAVYRAIEKLEDLSIVL